MEKKYDVVSLGELLVDFTVNGMSEQKHELFEANPGGAPCNVLAMLNKLGRKTSFIGKVGKDRFGEMLRETLESVAIGTENLETDEEVNTTLAFVHTLPDGDRDFSFYRNPGADMMLREEELKEEVIRGAKIFHFGTLSMTHEGIRNTTKRAVAIAKESGCLISFDPNLRPPLWRDMNEAREQIFYGMRQCDIMKISDNEVLFVSGMDTVEEGIRFISEHFSIRLLLVTLGKEGSIACFQGKQVKAAGFLQDNTVDTTGAGDTFCGCILHFVLDSGLETLREEQLKEMLVFANAAASLITTKKGAVCAMPEREQIIELTKMQ